MIDTSKRFIVVTNHQASSLLNAKGESRLQKEVLDPLISFRKVVVEFSLTDDGGLRDTLQEGDTILSCGGDGTANWLLNEMQHTEIANHVTLVPLGFGSANDISTGLYGGLSLPEIMTKGTPATAHAITATKETIDGNTYRYHALGYIGIGASGNAARAINADRKHMARAQVIARASTSVLASQQFMYSDQHGKLQRGFELLALNGRMSYAINPYRNHYFENAHQIVVASNVLEALGKIGLSTLHLVKGDLVLDEASTTIVPSEHVRLQTDGEAKVINPGESITISNGPTVKLARVSR